LATAYPILFTIKTYYSTIFFTVLCGPKEDATDYVVAWRLTYFGFFAELDGLPGT
jgi:hypothetical protein